MMCPLNRSIVVAVAKKRHIEPRAHIATEARNIVDVIAPKIGTRKKMCTRTARRAQMVAPVASIEATTGTSIVSVNESDPVTEIVRGTAKTAKNVIESTNTSVRKTDRARRIKIGGVAVIEKQRKMTGSSKTTNIALHVVVRTATRTRAGIFTNLSHKKSHLVTREKRTS